LIDQNRSAECAHSLAISECHTRALCYILTSWRAKGLREATEAAVLNANYIAAKLKHIYEIEYKGQALHEVVFLRSQSAEIRRQEF